MRKPHAEPVLAGPFDQVKISKPGAVRALLVPGPQRRLLAVRRRRR